MNTELETLSQETKRIRLAEAAGWKVNPDQMLALAFPDQRVDPTTGKIQVIPRYFSSLDAIAQIEATLTEPQLQRYGDALQDAVNYYCVGYVPNHGRDLVSLARIATAKPEQRCEALGQTLGLWQPGQ
jgi:hypothetical protein